jgi:hypothetical protein
MPGRRTRFTGSGSRLARVQGKRRREFLVGIVIGAAVILTAGAIHLKQGFAPSLERKAAASQTQAAAENIMLAQAASVLAKSHFTTQPAIGAFADSSGGHTSAQCAAALDANASSFMYNGHPINQETVPQNQQPHSPGPPATGFTSPVNQTKPNANQLAYYASDGYRSSEMDPPYTWMKLVDGQYTGTTEMIIRWAACKWGMDEDMIRAQATTEHGTWIQWNAGGDERRSINQCQAGNNPDHNSTSLWGYLISNACYQSWSIWQTKVVYSSPNIGAWTTWPAINESTAFAADYRYASQRSCMNGDQSGFFNDKGTGAAYLADVANAKNNPDAESPHRFWNPVSAAYATNLEYVAFACMGSHYSGNWMDSEARVYLNSVLTHWKKKDWLPK